MRHNQKGFSAAHAVLAILIIALIGFTGWFIWHKDHAKNVKATNGSEDTAALTDKTDPNAGYVVIKEWGVRFKPAGTVKASEVVVWSIKPEPEVPGTERAHLTTTSVEALGGTCKNADIAILSRTTQDPQQDSDEITRSLYETTGVKIGNYYYISASTQAACNDDQTTSDIQSAARAGLTKGLLKLEAAK